MALGQDREVWGELKVSAAEQLEYEAALFAKRITEIPSNMQKRLDYGVRTDSQSVYVGFAPKGLGVAENGWLLYYLQYDGSNRVTSITIAYDSWNNHDTTAVYS